MSFDEWMAKDSTYWLLQRLGLMPVEKHEYMLRELFRNIYGGSR